MVRGNVTNNNFHHIFHDSCFSVQWLEVGVIVRFVVITIYWLNYRRSLFFKLSFHNSVMGKAMWTTIEVGHWSLYFSPASQMIHTWTAIWLIFFIFIKIRYIVYLNVWVILYDVLLNMYFLQNYICSIDIANIIYTYM